MNKIKPKIYTKANKLICDWSDKKNYLIHYRLLKFYVRHGMIVDKIHEIPSFKQSQWLDKKSLIHKNEVRLKMNSKKICTNYLITDFTVKQWKRWEIVWG